MATQPKKMNIIKQVLIGYKNEMSVRDLAAIHSMSPTTVQRYLKIAREDPLGIDSLLQLDDPELNHRFNGGNPAYCDKRFEDFKTRLQYFEQELKHKHMTAQLLWEEYRQDVPDGYSLTQFRYHLKQNIIAVKPSTVLKMLHQPGAKMYIDFAGDKLSYIDMETGEIIQVETFVAVLPYSGYTYITCIPSQGIEHFLGAVDCAIRFFGGAPRMLVPDNLRSAVKSFDKWSPGITDGLNDLATHYGCCALPTRVRKPKDKALVEDAVHKGYKRIYAPLRNRVFHSIVELNKAIAELLEKYNSRRMQGCDYSRAERFLAGEKQELLPLPRDCYQMKRHAVLTVAPNSFIQLGTERHHYSVPNRLIGYKVEVVFTSSQVRIFHNGSCVATHPRSLRSGGYTYDSHHLPSQTQQYYAYSPQYFIDKGNKYGETVKHVLRELFSVTDRPAELYYRSAQGILALAKETDPKLFNMACGIAVKYDRCSYKFISNLVKSRCQGYLALQDGDMQTENIAPTIHSNIRGPQAFK
jgi:transposase